MMANSDNVGSIASLVFTGATGYFLNILECSLSAGREKIDMTLGSAANNSLRTAHPANTRTYEMDAKIIFTPSAAPTGIINLAPAQVDLTMKDAASTVYRFSSAFVESLDITFPNDERIEADAKIHLGGTYTVNPA